MECRPPSDGRIAEGVGRAVAALKADLMRPVSVGDLDPEILVQVDATVGANVSLYHRARHTTRVELIVPGRIQRISPVHPLAIAADLDRLRPATECLAVWVAGPSRDAANMHRSSQLGCARITNIVLAHLAGAPARHIEKPVVEREVDVGDQRWHGAESLKQRWKLVLLCRLGWNDRGFFAPEFVALAPPRPYRPLEIGRVHHNPNKAVFFNRVVRRSDLESHLVVGAQIDCLDIASRPQIPEVDPVAIFVAEQ